VSWPRLHGLAVGGTFQHSDVKRDCYSQKLFGLQYNPRLLRISKMKKPIELPSLEKLNTLLHGVRP